MRVPATMGAAGEERGETGRDHEWRLGDQALGYDEARGLGASSSVTYGRIAMR